MIPVIWKSLRDQVLDFSLIRSTTYTLAASHFDAAESV
jgi:hypothetical protein